MAQLRDMCFKVTDVGKVETGLSEDSLKLLRLFDGCTPFHMIQQTVDLPPAAFKRSFLDLFQKKMIEEVRTPDKVPESKEEFLDSSVFDQLRTNAVKVAGPLGELLITDALERLQLDPLQVPLSRVAELLHAIADDIPGEKQQKQFLDSLPPELLG